MFLGIEIGGTKLQIVAADAEGGILRRWRGAVRKSLGGPAICQQIAEGVSEILDNSGSKIRAAGIGFGGPVDRHSGAIRTSHQIPGWENFPLRDWLTRLIDAPVAIDNDANVAALGEARRGAGSPFNPVFYVTLGSGVGGGLVVDRQIYHGLPPGEAEFGHVRLDKSGATVESRCSGWAVDARIRALAAEEPDSLLARLIQGEAGGEARHLAPALAENDAAANRILHEVAGDLAFALSHVIHLLHPEAVVLGGGLSLAGEPLRSAVQAALPVFVMRAFLRRRRLFVLPGWAKMQCLLALLNWPRVFVNKSDPSTTNKRNPMPSTPPSVPLLDWIERYRAEQLAVINSIPADAVARLIERLRTALKEDRHVFIFGNGGSAANSSHFATDLGKGSSDKCGSRFRVISLNENVSWITALANDYHYDDVYARQLHNYAKPGDFVLTLSVSGNSPNLVKALQWARENGLHTAALVGAKRGKLAEIVDDVLVIDSHHYGRVEDAQMTICHMLCYAFMEMPELGKC